MVVPKGTHMDFYDIEQFVDLAIGSVSEFMKAQLS